MSYSGSHLTAALWWQDGAVSVGPYGDDVSSAADDGRSQRRLKLPTAQGDHRLSAGRLSLREKLQRKEPTKRMTASVSSELCCSATRRSVAGLHGLTSVMTGAHEFWRQRESHSFCLEHFPEHQPQLMKAGALRHMEQVMKWAHPGPAVGTLNIYMTERTQEDHEAV